MAGLLRQLLGLLERGLQSHLPLPQGASAGAFVHCDPSSSAERVREAHVVRRHDDGPRVERRDAAWTRRQHPYWGAERTRMSYLKADTWHPWSNFRLGCPGYYSGPQIYLIGGPEMARTKPSQKR